MTPIVLFRESLAEEGELEVCSQYFSVEHYRSRITSGCCVIGRYSVLPYYNELEEDLAYNGSYLINSYEQHKWIADFQWYEVLKDFTPETWTDYDFCRCDYKQRIALINKAFEDGVK